jgi:t-SNARE complex subunit (syntaxin)
LQNVKSIDEYIKDAFSNHFDLIIENANSQVDRVKGTFDKFKDKGLDLKKKYKELFVKKDNKELEKEKIEAEAAAAAAKAEEEKEALEQEVGIFGSIWNGITWPFRTFWDFITSFWS